MTKDFKIARKPGQGSAATVIEGELATEKPRAKRQAKGKPATTKPSFELGMTTRKTIEVPEGYFYQVKLHALKRKMKEKELWAEILEEYFQAHKE